MSDNVITISMDDVLGPDGLDGAWEAMVRKLTDRVEGKFLHSDAGKSFHKVAVEAINEAVAGKVAERVDALMAKPIQQTDAYGNPKGEPTTFDQMIGDAVSGAMETTVDLYGKPKPGKPNSMHDLTLFQYALQRIALKGLEGEVRKAAQQVRDDAKKAVATEVAKAIAKTIK